MKTCISFVFLYELFPMIIFEKAITQGLWSLSIISRGCFNLQLVKNTSPCRSPEIMKSKCHENLYNPTTTNASCISGILVTPSMHPFPTPLPFHQGLYRQRVGWVYTDIMHAWPKFLTPIQVSAGKLEAGFLEALLCMLHFLYLQWHDCH